MQIEQKHFDAMMNEVICKFWRNNDEDPINGYLTGIRKHTNMPFELESDPEEIYSNCEPIRTETYYKSREEVFKLLYLNNFKPDVNGNFWDKDGNVFRVDMWDYCGKSVSDRPSIYPYHSDWLEEKEI